MGGYRATKCRDAVTQTSIWVWPKSIDWRSDIPVGRGRVIAFGWSLGKTDNQVGWDIAKIILSGYLGVDAAGLVYQDIDVPRGQHLDGSLSLSLPAGTRAVVVTFWSPYSYSRLYEQRIVPAQPPTGR